MIVLGASEEEHAVVHALPSIGLRGAMAGIHRHGDASGFRCLQRFGAGSEVHRDFEFAIDTHLGEVLTLARQFLARLMDGFEPFGRDALHRGPATGKDRRILGAHEG